MIDMLYPSDQLKMFREFKLRWSEFEKLDQESKDKKQALVQKGYEVALERKKKNNIKRNQLSIINLKTKSI